jgi:YfiH family protein
MTTWPAEWLWPDWPAPARVRALITTRAGGSSTGPYGAPTDGGMNLGFGSGDAAAAVEHNRSRLSALLPSVPRWLSQVHGAAVVDAETVAGAVEADAAITDRPGTVAVVLIADCMPVFLTDRSGRAVGVAHAGWRGLAAGVIPATVRALRTKLGERDAELLAFLGPAIGPDHFEVGSEVLQAMTRTLPGAAAAFVPSGADKHRADLFALGKMALAEAGVGAVYGGGVCTHCDARRFYSHRRDRVTGRQAALIWIEATPAT